MDKQGRTLPQAVAIAFALTSTGAAATETRGALYGDLRLSLDYVEDRTAVPGPAFTGTDNQSVWGLKLSTARGGVTVFAGYERFIDADDPAVPGVPVEFTRQAYLGLASRCGTLKLGRHATAYSEAGRKLDPFYNTAASGTYGVAAAGSIFGGGNSHGSATGFNADALGAAYVADHLAYRSPAFAGFSGNLALFLDESGSADQRHDYGAGLEYAGYGATAGLQHINAHGANALTWGTGVDATRLYASYAGTRFGVGASWERMDLPGATTANFTLLSAWYGFRDDTRVAVSIGVEDDPVADGDSQRIGLFHDVIENFTVWAAARRFNDSTPANLDADVITLGASYKFDLGFSSD
ncbi:MAG: porin [Nevskiaceae bacterium]